MTLTALTALTAVLAGCSNSGGEATTVNLKATTMAFAQKELTVAKGKPVKLVLTNEDSVLHDFSIDEIDVKQKGSHGSDGHDMGGKEPDLHVSADTGKAATVEFTPNKEGTYTFYCTVTGHREAGMEGTLTVK